MLYPLQLVMQIIGENLEQYDDAHYPPIGAHVSDITMVKHLMQSHNLYQKDLADIFGGQANVSKFLHSERSLSTPISTSLITAIQSEICTVQNFTQPPKKLYR